MGREIIHIGIDAFFATLEVIDNPTYRFRPLIVSSKGSEGPKVISLNEQARRQGLRERMALAEASTICPQAIIAPARFKRYKEVSEKLLNLYGEYAPLVEPHGLDESFLDVSGCKGDFRHATQIAGAITRRLKREFKLGASAGVAPNKLLAWIASNLRKPGGFVVVEENRVADFLGPIPVRRIWGIGSVATNALERLGIETLGDLQRAGKKLLAGHFGREAERLARIANGEDDGPVLPDRRPRSLSAELTFPDPTMDLAVLKRTLKDLARTLENRLWKRNMKALTVAVKIHYAGRRPTRKCTTLLAPVDEWKQIHGAATSQLARTSAGSGAVRRIGIILTNLVPESGPYQMSLF